MQESYIALYRKYRPENFDDVVGQKQAVDVLTSAVKQKKVAHAYLFCGGRGTGKTSVARILAREVGCHPEDIIEIDAASNRGIDEIRELREAVRTAPFSSPYKVYIVDEVHMLTKEAANALLKTLEEPPEHVIFILATTDPEKLPETIVSRCQKVIFKEPDIETLSGRLTHVANQEGFVLPDVTSALIARHGKSSYRDALGYLEQVLRISKKNILHDDVVSLLGIPEREVLTVLVTAFCEKDSKEVVRILTDLEKKKSDAIRLYDEYVEMIRNLLLVRIGHEVSLLTEEEKNIATTYPKIIASSTILALLSKRNLLLVSKNHSFTAFIAILLSIIEG